MSSPLQRVLSIFWLALLAVAVMAPACLAQDHIVFTEVVLTERSGVPGLGCEYIELANPGATEVDLSDVFLTDATRITQPTQYYEIVTGSAAGGGGTAGDFHCRFPQGATIAPGDTILISVVGSNAFFASYQRLPDFELFEDGLTPDTIPEMVEVFPGSVGYGLGSGGTNTLSAEQWLGDTNGALLLYTWDGESDLVSDLDYVHWGALSTVRIDKSGVAVDGPDADGESSAYAADTPASSQQPISTATFRFGDSFQRNAFAEGAEIATGGNGISGHDETSEPLASTWTQFTGSQDPAASPVVNLPPAPIIIATELSPAVPRENQGATVTVTALAADGVATMTIWYRVDGGAFIDVACSDNGDDTWDGTIPGQALDAVVDWYLSTTGTGGGVAHRPVAAPTYVETYTVVAAPEPGEGPAKLLLTEICTKGSAGEFIEIMNPNDFDVNLGDYYLTDAVYYEQGYFKIAAGATQTTVGGGAFYDFNARFPEDAVLPAGESTTISVPGSNSFADTYLGSIPGYELFEDGDFADQVPDMREIFPGSIRGTDIPSLTNINLDTSGGEIVVLYYWDGVSDLTVDIDAFAWGDGNSYRYNKSGLTVLSSSYAPEAGYPNPYMADHGFEESFQRVDFTEGTQAAVGSNGVDGRDETSENLPLTWGVAPADPASPPLPEGAGVVTLSTPPRTFLPTMAEGFPVSFSSAPGSLTILRIFDLDGRLVRTLYHSQFDGPASVDPEHPTEMFWDGRNDEFELVKAGMYIVHLSVRNSENGDSETKTAPAVVATRLSK